MQPQAQASREMRVTQAVISDTLAVIFFLFFNFVLRC